MPGSRRRDPAGSRWWPRREGALRQQRLQAEAAYENGQLMARDLIERIGELFYDMPAPGVEERPINWCDVGSIAEVNRRLTSIVAFLESTEV